MQKTPRRVASRTDLVVFLILEAVARLLHFDLQSRAFLGGDPQREHIMSEMEEDQSSKYHTSCTPLSRPRVEIQDAELMKDAQKMLDGGLYPNAVERRPFLMEFYKNKIPLTVHDL